MRSNEPCRGAAASSWAPASRGGQKSRRFGRPLDEPIDADSFGGAWPLSLIWLPLALSIGAGLVTYVLFAWAPLGSGESPTVKHFVVLVAMTMLGTVGAIYHPFWGLLLYYTLAVLRPQYLWEWSLPVEWRWSLIAGAVAFMGVAMNLHTIVDRGRINRVLVLMVAFALLLLLSCLTAHDPATAQKWGIEYAKIFTLAILTSLVIDRSWQVRAMTAMILLCLGYIAWEVNSLYFFQGRLDIFHYGFGGLDNNGAGLMLAMGLPFAYAYGVSAPRRWMRAASWVIGLLIVHAILMSYSRGAMLAGSVGVAWVLLHHRRRWQSLVIGLLLLVAVSYLAGAEIRDRFFSTLAYSRDGSAHSRFESWSAAWNVALDHPVTGVGIRNSNSYSENYGADRHGRTIHSQYLQIAADSGFPALIVYLALLGAALLFLRSCRLQCLGLLNSKSHDPPGHGVRAGLVSHFADLALACQASLLIFAFGGLFLSLEVFELPWLLLVLAGAFPRVVHRVARQQEQEQEQGAASPRIDVIRPLLPAPAIRFAHRGITQP